MVHIGGLDAKADVERSRGCEASGYGGRILVKGYTLERKNNLDMNELLQECSVRVPFDV